MHWMIQRHVSGRMVFGLLTFGLAMSAASLARAGEIAIPFDKPEDLTGWEFEYEKWRVKDGALSQSPVISSQRGSAIWWTQQQYSDLDLTVEFRVAETQTPAFGGVRVLYRAESPSSYHTLSVDLRPGKEAVILSRVPRGQGQTRAGKAPGLTIGQWHTLRIVAEGQTHTAYLDGEVVASKVDAGVPAGAIGLWIDRVPVEFRNLRMVGMPVETDHPFEVKSLPYITIAGGGGDPDYPYAGFPDLVRSRSGDLLCVYYAGYKHVPSGPGEQLPQGGKICLVRSQDQGKTWSAPQTIYDSAADDHDPHISQLSDGRLAVTICSWPVRGTHKPFIIWSDDDGHTWSEGTEISPSFEATEVPSGPIVEMPDGRLLLPTYGMIRRTDSSSSAVVRVSSDHGKTWPWTEAQELRSPETEGHDRSVWEPEIARLPDDRLLLVARQKMWWSESTDGGETWSPLQPMPVRGDAPDLFVTSNNMLLCGIRYRGGEGGINRGTCVLASSDLGKTWSDPVLIAPVIGGYTGMAELPDGRIFIAYYTESAETPAGGEGSEIRGTWFRATSSGITFAPEE